MIDLDLKPEISPQARELSILILRNGAGSYCTAVKDWADILHRVHPNSTVFDYTEVYLRDGRRALEQALLRLVDERRADVLYFDSPFKTEFDLAFLAGLRPRLLLALVTDDAALFFNDWFRYLAQAFDLVLTHDYVEKFRFELYGTKSLFMPMVSNPESYFQRETRLEDKDIDVSSVGRLDRVGRREMLASLIRADVGLQLYGEGTPNGLVGQERKIDVFRRSKIGLNFSGCAEYFHSPSVRRIDKRIRQVKGRLWELALCKTLVLTEYAPCLEKSFRIGAELDVFEDGPDLVQKVRYYLEHDDQRRQMALEGYRRAAGDCAPAEVCSKLVNVLYAMVKAARRSAPPICLDDEFRDTVCEERAALAVRLWRLGRRRLALGELKAMLGSGRFLQSRAPRVLLKELARPWLGHHPAILGRIRALRTAPKPPGIQPWAAS